MKEFRKKFTKEYLEGTKKILDSMAEDLITQIDKLASILIEARENKNTIFIMGNGGSALTASHFAGDLSKGTIVEGFPRFKAVALTESIPKMLAWANDVGYEEIFIEQLRNLIEPGDVVIGISGSGNSPNIIKAIEYTNRNGGLTIGLCGCDGGKLLKCAQENIHVPCSYMQRVEDIHLLIEHLVTSLIREEQEQNKEHPE
ncbi:SIS domain-containing protein [Chloroflexota bacterium]